MNATIVATLPAADIDRAKAWYRDNLGLKPFDDSMEGARYEIGGGLMMLYRSTFAGTNRATAAGFEVDDFDATIAELRTKGVQLEDYDFGEGFTTVDGVLTGPDGRRGAWFKDSEGNTLGLAERG